MRFWMKEHIYVADAQQNTQFRRTKMEVRHLESGQGIGSEKNLRREQQISHEHPRRNQRIHVPRSSHSCEQSRNTEAVDDVVDIKPISRTLPVPIACDRAVETVAEPIHGEKQAREQQSITIETS